MFVLQTPGALAFAFWPWILIVEQGLPFGLELREKTEVGWFGMAVEALNRVL
jgi:hypothetical protein